MTRFEVHFSGRVQGVGFRYTTKQVARAYDVTGTVQNLADGRVRLVCEGEAGSTESFINEVATSTHGHVTDVEIERSPATGEFNGFEILR